MIENFFKKNHLKNLNFKNPLLITLLIFFISFKINFSKASDNLINLKLGEIEIPISLSEVIIISSSIEGLSVAQEGTLTVALDITLDDNLRKEGAAREFINRVQSIRKNKNLNLTDRILINVTTDSFLEDTIVTFSKLIKNETLANDIKFFKPQKIIGDDHLINGSKILINIVEQNSH